MYWDCLHSEITHVHQQTRIINASGLLKGLKYTTLACSVQLRILLLTSACRLMIIGTQYGPTGAHYLVLAKYCP